MGPLRHASIDLRPLTVFIGPNNSGKSFAATVIYSALSHSTTSPIRFALDVLRFMPSLGKAESSELQALANEVLTVGRPPAYEDLPQLLSNQLSSLLSHSVRLFGQRFAAELTRSAGAELA